ncbi:hypothetical protein [Polycladidibacter hongkongensis]|uniref:hypothetical protein n=1 Tax=Polycladidibacter hongkongensis TaxID=1647556 RepID=UPI00082A83B8|nr:hypothetical protein [Pseudovibrio hongkongensis]
MTQLTFFPIGNADTCLIELQDGRRMLVDYADMSDGSKEDKRCNLKELLSSDFKDSKQDQYEVVAFTHLDDDHCKRASEYFYLEHAVKYQSSERKKIKTLWVPAAAVTEEGLDDDARVIRQEARYRLKNGKGVKVFSRPERLKKWLEQNNLTVEKRRSCFVDAGQLVPDFDLEHDAVEVFVHSPHAKRSDENGLEDRNGDSLVFQMRFQEQGTVTDVLFSADVDHKVLAEIVDITKGKKNDDRLHWSVFKLPHHCSYLSLSDEKGKDQTTPIEQVQWLCEEQGEEKGYVVSSSRPIPMKNSLEDRDVQPPHRQAANYYKNEVITAKNFLVTMETPNQDNPKPIKIEIGRDGAVKKLIGVPAAAAILGGSAPRAG